MADPDNGYQWDDKLRQSRELDQRPCLTVNKTHQHWLMVVNDGKQNKPSIKVHATGGDATYQSAQVFGDIIRHIEYMSNAQSAYDTASEFQVGAGIGYWRVRTDYIDDSSFDQDILISPILDSLSVFMDPDMKERDGSDAKFCLVFTDLTHESFKAKYPGHSDAITASAPLGNGAVWITEDHIRICEYFEVKEMSDTLYAIPDDQGGEPMLVHASDANPALKKALKQMGDKVRSRKVKRAKVMWYLIAGNELLDTRELLGKYIPIVRVVGEEMVIQGKLERKGIVRYLKDPQRIYNYNTSSAVEFGALQSKIPYTAAVEAIEGFEGYYETANTKNHSYLPFNAFDEQGRPLEAPSRQAAPMSAPVYMEGMQTAAEEMKMVSGQYDALMGAPSNEQSGVAIDQRQRQGDRATYHFIDGLAKAIRFTGKILINLIPLVYDTPRVLRIRGEDGTSETPIKIDPNQKTAYQEQKSERTGEIQRIFNPGVGTYDVVADVGPSFDTKREETFNAIKDILSANPALTQVIGDLLFKVADFPLADKIEERMKNWIPAAIQGKGPTAEEQQMQQQLQQAQQALINAHQKDMKTTIMIERLMQELSNKKSEIAVKSQEVAGKHLEHLAGRMDSDERVSLERIQKLIDAYQAETSRLDVLLSEGINVPNEQEISRNLLRDTEETTINQPN